MFSIGKSKGAVKYSILHSHSSDEVILNIAGTGKITVENREFPFGPGDIIYIPAGMKHIKCPDDTFEDIYFQVKEPFYSKIVLGNDDENKSALKMTELLYFNYYKNGQKEDKTVLSIYMALNEILAECFEKEKKQTPADKLYCAIINGFADPEFEIANEMPKLGYSADYLRRTFVAKYGISPKEFLINLRLDKAILMMKNGDYTVSELSVLCGYYDASYFTRLFGKKYKMTPSQYKKSVLS